MLKLAHNRIGKGELVIHQSHFLGTWSRVLFDYNGSYVEVDLSPRYPNQENAWNIVRSINIRRHSHMRGHKDRTYRAVQLTSQLYKGLSEAMRNHLEDQVVAQLLGRDWLKEIDWDRYRRHRAYGQGGIPFSECCNNEAET